MSTKECRKKIKKQWQGWRHPREMQAGRGKIFKKSFWKDVKWLKNGISGHTETFF
jgi:hypothetical protein